MELRVKVWLRLDNIIKLQKILVKHLDSFPSLPNAYVAEKTIGGSKDGAGPSGLQGTLNLINWWWLNVQLFLTGILNCINHFYSL